MLIYKRGETPFEVDPATLSEQAKAYLLQYGWAQSLQDSIAGAAKAKQADLEATDDFKSGKMTPEGLADEVELHVLGKLEARAKAIIEGTVSARVGGPRMDDVAKLAQEQVLAALSAKGKKIDRKSDDGKALLARLVADHVAKSGDKLRAEIERRKTATPEVEIDLDI